MSILFWQAATATAAGRVSLRSVLGQVYEIGVARAPLTVTGILSGVVTSQQGGYQVTSALPLYILGSVVASRVILELGPVMTAFVLIGRVGARITAELGTMQVSEQIDALYSLGRDPVACPPPPGSSPGPWSRPCSWAWPTWPASSREWRRPATVGLGQESFLYGARLFWHSWDMFYSLMKATVFGFIIPLIACHMGLLTRGGAEGVGRSTTTAVVIMIITVLVLDALFPPLFLN